jgi:hypothetical protein
MTFIQFLKELEQKLKGSESYPMTTHSVRILLNMRIQQKDINIIFDAINNDTFHNNDPLSLRNLWNEKRLISKSQF